MYTVTKISSIINDEIMDVKIPLKNKNQIIKKFNLLSLGKVKEYWINNLNILNINGSFKYDYVIDEINYIDKDKKLFIEMNKKIECIPFNFYKCDIEEEYELYKNNGNLFDVRMKVFHDYIILEIIGEKLDEIKNNII